MGILHGTLVMCKTFTNYICCKPLFSHATPIEPSTNSVQANIYEYQGLLQEDTTIEIKDQKIVSEQSEPSNENVRKKYFCNSFLQQQLDPSCNIDKSLILSASKLQQNLLSQLKAPLDGWQQIYKEKKKPHKLTIHTKSYTTQENNKVNVLRSTFFVPDVMPQTWVKFYNDAEAQRSLDSKLDRYVIVENYLNYFINYASYRKMLMIDSRDILYFKSLSQKNPYIIDACKSIELSTYPPVESKTRAQIFLSGYAVSEYTEPTSQQTGTLVEMYSDIDMKMNVPALISRPAAIKEVKGYVEKSVEKLNTIKEKYSNVPDII